MGSGTGGYTRGAACGGQRWGGADCQPNERVMLLLYFVFLAPNSSHLEQVHEIDHNLDHLQIDQIDHDLDHLDPNLPL